MFNWLFPLKYFPDGRAMNPSEESAHWIVICATCGYETNIAKLGGIRYRARGGGKCPRINCPTCGHVTRTRLEWRAPQA